MRGKNKHQYFALTRSDNWFLHILRLEVTPKCDFFNDETKNTKKSWENPERFTKLLLPTVAIGDTHMKTRTTPLRNTVCNGRTGLATKLNKTANRKLWDLDGRTSGYDLWIEMTSEECISIKFSVIMRPWCGKEIKTHFSNRNYDCIASKNEERLIVYPKGHLTQK